MGVLEHHGRAVQEHGIGGHDGQEEGDDQFEIADGRTVDQVVSAIRTQGLQPVMNDYVYV